MFAITHCCVSHDRQRRRRPDTISMVAQYRNHINKEERQIMTRHLRAMLITFVLILVSGLFSTVFAVQKGSENKGRFYFRQTCKECHTKGAPEGEITPLNKTIAQGRTYFAKAPHHPGKNPLLT